MIVDYIDSQRESHGVEPICSVLAEAGVPIASSTYYAHKATPVSAAMLEEAHLVPGSVTGQFPRQRLLPGVDLTVVGLLVLDWR